jgi:hypothetical protein
MNNVKGQGKRKNVRGEIAINWQTRFDSAK